MIIKKLVVILSVFYTSVTFSQPRYLIPFRDGNLWGYSDTNLNIIVKPKYDQTGIYSYGFGLVQKGKYFGYLNAKGVEVVAPQYTYLSQFWQNYVVVSKDTINGIIQLQTGKVVLPLNFRNIMDAGNDLFIVIGKKGAQGIFNASKGTWLLNLEYRAIKFDSFGIRHTYYTAFKGTRAIRFSLSDKGIYSTISNTEIVYHEIKKAEVTPLPAEEEKIEEILEDQIDSNNTGIACAYLVNGKMGFYNLTIKDGLKKNDSVPAIFDDIRLIPGTIELLIVKRNGKEGVISLKNREVIPLKFDEVKAVDSSFSHGIYIVRLNEKYGLAQGNTQLLNCKYDTIFQAKEGFHLVTNHKAGLYIYDKEKSLFNVLIEAEYDYILDIRELHPSDFLQSIHNKNDYKTSTYLVYISFNNKRGYINLNGKKFFTN